METRRKSEYNDRPVCQRRNTTKCNDANLRLKQTRADGNCLYHAVSRILASRYIKRTYSVVKLRKLVAFRIKNASESFIHRARLNFTVAIEDHAWLQDSREAQKDSDVFRQLWAQQVLGNEWGDETVLQILSDHFFVTFLVLDDRCRLIGKTYNPDSTLVAILHLEGAHYSNIYHLSYDQQEEYIHEKTWICAQSFGESFREENDV